MAGPVGVTKIVGAFQRRSPGDVAAFVTVVVEDENGDKWSFGASSFNFDMERYNEEEVGISGSKKASA